MSTFPTLETIERENEASFLGKSSVRGIILQNNVCHSIFPTTNDILSSCEWGRVAVRRQVRPNTVIPASAGVTKKPNMSTDWDVLHFAQTCAILPSIVCSNSSGCTGRFEL